MTFDTDRSAPSAHAVPWAASATLAVAMLMAAPAAMAAEPAPGMRVTKDPITGQLRALTSDEAAALENAAAAKGNARVAPPRGLLTGRINPGSIRHPDGSVEQELDESSLTYSVATKGPGGKLNTYCVTGPEAAAAIVNGKKGITKSAKEQTREEK